MPTAPPARCTEPRCDQLTTVGRCPNHQRKPWEQRSPRDRISRRPWRRARAQQLAAEPDCRHCGRLADEVDHILPIALGGAERDPANLQSLCGYPQPDGTPSCHDLKTHEDRKAIAAAR